MALADRDPDRLKAAANDQRRVEAELAGATSRAGHPGQSEPSERQSEGDRGYGRQGGSIADTGTRTDVPVGVGQIESSAVDDPSGEQARERQESPPGASADRDKARPDDAAG